MDNSGNSTPTGQSPLEETESKNGYGRKFFFFFLEYLFFFFLGRNESKETIQNFLGTMTMKKMKKMEYQTHNSKQLF